MVDLEDEIEREANKILHVPKFVAFRQHSCFERFNIFEALFDVRSCRKEIRDEKRPSILAAYTTIVVEA